MTNAELQEGNEQIITIDEINAIIDSLEKLEILYKNMGLDRSKEDTKEEDSEVEKIFFPENSKPLIGKLLEYIQDNEKFQILGNFQDVGKYIDDLDWGEKDWGDWEYLRPKNKGKWHLVHLRSAYRLMHNNSYGNSRFRESIAVSEILPFLRHFIETERRLREEVDALKWKIAAAIAKAIERRNK